MCRSIRDSHHQMSFNCYIDCYIPGQRCCRLEQAHLQCRQGDATAPSHPAAGRTPGLDGASPTTPHLGISGGVTGLDREMNAAAWGGLAFAQACICKCCCRYALPFQQGHLQKSCTHIEPASSTCGNVYHQAIRHSINGCAIGLVQPGSPNRASHSRMVSIPPTGVNRHLSNYLIGLTDWLVGQLIAGGGARRNDNHVGPAPLAVADDRPDMPVSSTCSIGKAEELGVRGSHSSLEAEYIGFWLCLRAGCCQGQEHVIAAGHSTPCLRHRYACSTSIQQGHVYSHVVLSCKSCL